MLPNLTRNRHAIRRHDWSKANRGLPFCSMTPYVRVFRFRALGTRFHFDRHVSRIGNSDDISFDTQPNER